MSTNSSAANSAGNDGVAEAADSLGEYEFPPDDAPVVSVSAYQELETWRSAKSSAPVQVTSQTAEPTLIPATEVKPEDIGALSLRYVNGVAQLVVSGGTAIPAGLTVVDADGNDVAAYKAAGPVEVAAPEPRYFIISAVPEFPPLM
ncbi:hypothetical protein [Streptomyces cyaneofuscatus]|uniref:hypothetical protein n=1 Tax=Streptomyces cyaneofuscatus TaxID=66883 RepID=UPI0036633D4F